jgi:phosphoribosylanthranilate isomerase
MKACAEISETYYGETPMRVKICGITRLQDALVAVECGAHSLGFVFVPGSPRFISAEKAREIIRMIPPYVTAVGVFVDVEEKEVHRIVERSGVGVAQFHGSERPAFLRRFSFPVYKAFRVTAGFDLGVLQKYPGQAFLLDASAEGSHGATGPSMSWPIAARGAEYGKIILAGGLTAENVVRAIECARPYAVDVSSGVERSPGIKDGRKIASFMKAVASAG